MPIERREILFDFNELTALFTGSVSLKIFLPKNCEDAKIVEAHHNRNFDRLHPDTRRKFASLHERMADKDAVMIRIRCKGPDNQQAFDIFAIPDSALLPVLIMECRARKIVLPRSGVKTIVATEMYVGLQITHGKTQTSRLEMLEI